MIRCFVLALALAACTKATPDPTQPDDPTNPAKPGVAMDVAVELSGVTLGEECGDSAPPPSQPAASPAASQAAKPASDNSVSSMRQPSAGGCADPANCHGPTQRQALCEQTSMQLSLHASGGPGPMKIQIKKIDLLDASDKVLGQLTARKPSRWDDKGNYVTWDESIAPSQTIATSYLLSSPDWNKISNGRLNAQGKLFKLRVTITVGSSERTVEKQVMTPFAIEPTIQT